MILNLFTSRVQVGLKMYSNSPMSAENFNPKWWGRFMHLCNYSKLNLLPCSITKNNTERIKTLSKYEKLVLSERKVMLTPQLIAAVLAFWWVEKVAKVFQPIANLSNALPWQTRKPLYVFNTYISRSQLDVKFQQKVNTNVSDQAGESLDFLPFHQPTRLSQQYLANLISSSYLANGQVSFCHQLRHQ